MGNTAEIRNAFYRDLVRQGMPFAHSQFEAVDGATRLRWGKKFSALLPNPDFTQQRFVNRFLLGGDPEFVVYTKNSFFYNGVEMSHEDSKHFWQAIYDLALVAGVDLPKVYGIHQKTAESVWFKRAVLGPFILRQICMRTITMRN